MTSVELVKDFDWGDRKA